MTADNDAISPRSTPPRKVLLRIYRLFEEWARDFDFVCARGCATCCTRSVTMTTLEGELIVDYLKTRPDLHSLLQALPYAPTPVATTNRFARSCLDGTDGDADPGGWDLAPCVFLHRDCCQIYPVRPFMCRSFGSRVPCSQTGSAEVDPFFLTLTTVIMQCIEHLDRGRPWGNLNSILRLLASAPAGGEELPTAQPLPGFLIPPEEEAAIKDRLEILLALVRGS